jgi:hypothetical protein
MRKQRGFIAALVALSILASSAAVPFRTKAATNFASVQETVNVALSEKNFYYFNLAFERIMKLEDGNERAVLLSQLDTITNVVWTQEIGEIVANFVVIANEKSGRVFDEAQAKINKSSLKEIDKQYLLHELSTWGRDTVWTSDYITAVDSIIKVWYDKTQPDLEAAQAAISSLAIEANRVYLTELLDEAKIAVGLAEPTAPVEEDTTLPAEETTAPADEVAAPVEESTPAEETSTVPADEAVTPSEEAATVPSEQTAPVEETATTPTDDTAVTPAQDVPAETSGSIS